MSNANPLEPDYSIDRETYAERGESLVRLVWPVRVNERIEQDITDRYDDDLKQYGDSYVNLRYDGERAETQRLGNSLVNLDAYLTNDPHCIVDAPDEWVVDGRAHQSWSNRSPGDIVLERAGWPDLSFELYQRELIEAAKQRAVEDCTHHVRVLACWVYLAFPSGDDDRFGRTGLSPLRATLAQEAATHPNTSWALCWDGDPDRWDYDDAPVGYDPDEDSTGWEQELRHFEAGGFDAVLEQRGDDDD
jgi:hypothetical protein